MQSRVLRQAHQTRLKRGVAGLDAPNVELVQSLCAARDFVSEFWPDIELLAERLRRTGKMTGIEVARLLLSQG